MKSHVILKVTKGPLVYKRLYATISAPCDKALLFVSSSNLPELAAVRLRFTRHVAKKLKVIVLNSLDLCYPLPFLYF